MRGYKLQEKGSFLCVSSSLEKHGGIKLKWIPSREKMGMRPRFMNHECIRITELLLVFFSMWSWQYPKWPKILKVAAWSQNTQHTTCQKMKTKHRKLKPKQRSVGSSNQYGSILWMVRGSFGGSLPPCLQGLCSTWKASQMRRGWDPGI